MNLYATYAAIKRDLHNVATTVTDYDTVLGDLSNAVSRAIDHYTHTQFWVEKATRYYPEYDLHDSCREMLLPAHLISVTSSRADTDDDGTYDYTLVEGTDYRIAPYNRSEGRRRLELMRRGTQINYWPKWRHTLEVVGVWGWALDLTTLTAATAEAVDTTETVIDVTSPALTEIEVGQTIRLTPTGTYEDVYVTAVTDAATDTITVVRAQNGTTAATHVTSSVIDVYRYPRPVTEAVILQVEQWRQSLASGGSDMAGGGSFTSRVPSGLHPNIRNALAAYAKVAVL